MKSLGIIFCFIFSAFLAQAQNQATIITISQACIGGSIDLSYDANQSPLNGYDVFTGVGLINGSVTPVTMYNTGTYWVMDFGAGGVYYYNTSTSTVPPVTGWLPVDVNNNGNAQDDCNGTNPIMVSLVNYLGLESYEWSADRIGNESVLLRYAIMDLDVSKIEIEKSSDLDNWVVIHTEESNLENSFLDESAANIQNFYRMKVYDGNGSSYSEILRVERSQNKELLVYPNPAHDRIFVSSEIAENAELSIYSSIGTLLDQVQIQDNAGMDISTLPAGMYLLRIKTQGGTEQSTIFQKN